MFDKFIPILEKLSIRYPSLGFKLYKDASSKDKFNNKFRHIRVNLLKHYANTLSKVMQVVNFQQSIMVDANGNCYVNDNGIFLSTAATNRYFKVVAANGNEGAAMDAFIRQHNIVPNIVFDIGANFGEVSLHFAKEYPEAKVIAVEPSKNNLKILYDNLANQKFSVENIQVVEKAIMDTHSTLKISEEFGSENSLVSNQNNKTLDFTNGSYSQIEAIPLADLMQSLAPDETVDFMKIDIEGAEPLLEQDLMRYAPRIDSILIEFSAKNSQDKYVSLLKTLMETRHYICYIRGRESKSYDFEAVREQYITASNKGGGLDVWFIKRGQE